MVLRLMATAMLDDSVVSATETLDLVFQVNAAGCPIRCTSCSSNSVLTRPAYVTCLHDHFSISWLQANEEAGLIERAAFHCDAINQVCGLCLDGDACKSEDSTCV